MRGMAFEKAKELIAACKERGGMLLPLLEDINAEYGYLPPEVLRMVARELDCPLSQLYSLATFYNVFRLEPRGRHLVQVCLGTTCYVRGGTMVLEKLERELGVREGQTTPDGQFTLESVHCMGCCSLAPAVRIDEDIYGRVRTDRIPRLLRKYREKGR